jgi:hypothetical protein
MLFPKLSFDSFKIDIGFLYLWNLFAPAPSRVNDLRHYSKISNTAETVEKFYLLPFFEIYINRRQLFDGIKFFLVHQNGNKLSLAMFIY